MKKYFEILKKCPLFHGIDEEDFTNLLVCLGAKVESFDKNYTVFMNGKPIKYIGIVLSGSVQISANDFYGNRSILSSAQVSELIGEAFALAGVDSVPISVVANEPCEIMFIPCERVLYSCANSCDFHQRMIFNLMKNLAVKNIKFYQKIEVVSKRSTREKLMAYLNIRAGIEKSKSFKIPYDRQELADYLEVDRSGLSAEISKLRKEGIIRCRKNQFELLI